MAWVAFSRRLVANDLTGLIWLPTILFAIFGANRLAALVFPQVIAAMALSEALYFALMVVLAGGLLLAAVGIVPDRRLARAAFEEGLSQADRIALAGRSPSVLVALGAWPIAASLTAIVLGGYFNLALLFIIVWGLGTGVVFPNCLGSTEQPRS